jgi:hypothetical protein
LNPTNNVSRSYRHVRLADLLNIKITEAIRRYGVSDSTASLLVVRIDAGTLPANEIEVKMKNIVDGDLVPFSDLDKVTDWSTIKKVCAI